MTSNYNHNFRFHVSNPAKVDYVTDNVSYDVPALVEIKYAGWVDAVTVYNLRSLENFCRGKDVPFVFKSIPSYGSIPEDVMNEAITAITYALAGMEMPCDNLECFEEDEIQTAIDQFNEMLEIPEPTEKS